VSTSSNGYSFKASIPGDANAAAAVAAYQKYRDITTEMTAKADYSTNLADYADGNVLTLANNFVEVLKRGNEVMTGTVSESLSVKTVNMSAAPLPLVTILECKDASKYHEVYAYGPNKGQVSGTTIAHPYPVTYGVHKSADGKWRVTSVQAESDKTC
jgi:hypothetical protein